MRLSEYRGKSVWLYLWRIDSPTCRQDIPRLQSLYDTHKDKGPVVLGLNVGDHRRIVGYYLQNRGITFPILFDVSKPGVDMVSRQYGHRFGELPLSYLIDRQGKVIDAWYEQADDVAHVLSLIEQDGPETPIPETVDPAQVK